MNKILKRTFLWAGLLIVAGFGCVPRYGHDNNSIVVSTWPSDPPSLHPVCGNISSARVLVFDYTQKTLTRTDMRTLKQIPLLVKGLGQLSPDGKEISYELRDDVKWDDGTPLTVDDVIFTMKATKCPLSDDAMVRSVYDNVKDITKDNANPQKFTMMAKDVYYNNAYLFDELYLVEKKHWDSTGVLDKVSLPALDDKAFDGAKYPGLNDWAKAFNDGTNGHDVKKLCGLGAYAVTDWKPGSAITLTRKSKWWGENDTSVYSRAYPSQIVIKIVPDDQARFLAVKNHSVDAEMWLFTQSYAKLKADKDFNDNYYSGLTDQYNYNLIYLNTKPDGTKHPKIFDDKTVRHAVALLAPIDEMNKTLILGMGTRMASYISPVFKDYYNTSLALVPYDVEKAKKMLEDDGWKDTDGDNIRDKMVDGKKIPLSFHLTYSATPINKEAALMIKDAMYKAGVEVIPDPVDQVELQKRASTHDFDMEMAGFSGGSIPDDPIQFLGSMNWANNGSNFTGFGNAESDRIIDESNKAMDVTKRIELLKQLQAIVYKEQPFIFMYGIKRKIVISKKFEQPGMFTERPGVMLNNLKLKQK